MTKEEKYRVLKSIVDALGEENPNRQFSCRLDYRTYLTAIDDNDKETFQLYASTTEEYGYSIPEGATLGEVLSGFNLFNKKEE